MLNDPEMQSNIGIFSTPEELQQQWEDCRRGIVPADPVHRAADPVGQRPRPGAAGEARRVGLLVVVPGRGDAVQLRRDEGGDGATGDRQDHQAGAEFRGPHHQAHHLHPQAHGHDVRGARRRLLPRPDPPGSNRASTDQGRKAMSTNRSRSKAFISAVPAATADQVSPSSPATTPPSRHSPSRSSPYCVWSPVSAGPLGVAPPSSDQSAAPSSAPLAGSLCTSSSASCGPTSDWAVSGFSLFTTTDYPVNGAFTQLGRRRSCSAQSSGTLPRGPGTVSSLGRQSGAASSGPS